MWRRLKHIAASFNSYSALSPDLRLRQQVNQQLYNRAALDLNAWCKVFDLDADQDRAIAQFLRDTLQHYSGLDVSRVRPEDCLEADLQWSQVCWFDWDVQLCDAFSDRFKVTLGDRFYDFDPVTVADIVQFFCGQSISHSAYRPSD